MNSVSRSRTSNMPNDRSRVEPLSSKDEYRRIAAQYKAAKLLKQAEDAAAALDADAKLQKDAEAKSTEDAKKRKFTIKQGYLLAWFGLVM
jgi:hypothetical protein